MATRMQYCFNCGQELGVYASCPGDIEDCGSQKCVRAAREDMAAAREDRYLDAAEDDFSRY